VEVDVVGHGGCCWVEVKHQEVFGTDSIHWQVCVCVGGGGRNMGEGGVGRGRRRRGMTMCVVCAG
jgi:hypothetical protein